MERDVRADRKEGDDPAPVRVRYWVSDRDREFAREMRRKAATLDAEIDQLEGEIAAMRTRAENLRIERDLARTRADLAGSDLVRGPFPEFPPAEGDE